MSEITYTQIGDYLLPNLTMGDEPQPTYGKYGMLRKQYLKEHRKAAYASLLLSGKLSKHLAETDTRVKFFIFRLVKEMAQKPNRGPSRWAPLGPKVQVLQYEGPEADLSGGMDRLDPAGLLPHLERLA
jgi:hypothetical protein